MRFINVVSAITGGRYCEAYLVDDTIVKGRKVWMVIPKGKEGEFHKLVGKMSRGFANFPMDDNVGPAMRKFSSSDFCMKTYQMHFCSGKGARVKMLKKMGFMKKKRYEV